ncbi:8094_t:CDS:1 [Gigaspora margarita]|uniref:8094_t:CDS:1 n=1 Tax=Gigaspora margarita TaxID=4874 RepID=A0ABN7VI55_GIGMA|nr:8094_t:CDS:1 [Gigaspora margarita]
MSQPQPLKLNVIPSISQTLRLPIPRPSVPIKHSEMLSSNWPPSTPDFMINSATFPVIPCQQQTVPAGPTGKPVPNRRGRKRLATLPSNKKHKQNLTNQRAFRERRENYLKSLESKVDMYEKAYAEYQNENRQLKEEVAILKRRLSRFENYGFDGGLGITSSDMQLSDKVSDNKNANPCCNVVNSLYSVSNMIEDNQIYHGIEHKDNSTHRNVIINNCSSYLQDYSTIQINNESSSFTPKSYSPLSTENLSSFMQEYEEPSIPKNRSRSSTHSSTIYCDEEISGQSRISPGNNSIATVMSRQCANQEFSTTTRQTLPTPDEPQWSLPHEHYFNSTLTPVSSSFPIIDSERGSRLYN